MSSHAHEETVVRACVLACTVCARFAAAVTTAAAEQGTRNQLGGPARWRRVGDDGSGRRGRVHDHADKGGIEKRIRSDRGRGHRSL